jgi:hypothetical protein
MGDQRWSFASWVTKSCLASSSRDLAVADISPRGRDFSYARRAGLAPGLLRNPAPRKSRHVLGLRRGALLETRRRVEVAAFCLAWRPWERLLRPPEISPEGSALIAAAWTATTQANLGPQAQPQLLSRCQPSRYKVCRSWNESWSRDEDSRGRRVPYSERSASDSAHVCGRLAHLYAERIPKVSLLDRVRSPLTRGRTGRGS